MSGFGEEERDPLQFQVDVLVDEMTALVRLVDNQQDELGQLRQMFRTAPRGAIDDDDEVLMPFIWHELDDADTEEYNTRLAQWVEWLVHRYRLDDHIPECWAHHGVFIEELTALWIAWETSYRQSDNARAASSWHNDLGWMLGRISGYWKRQACARGAHSTSTANWAALPAPDRYPGGT